MKIIPFILVGACLSFTQCTSPKASDSKATSQAETSVGQEKTLKQQVADGAIIVDVRTPEEFSAGNYPGSINIPLDQVQSRIDEFKNKPGVILYCRSGNRSGKAKVILEENGIKNVSNGINVDHLKTELQ